MEAKLIEKIHELVLGSLKPEDTLVEVSKLIFAYKELKKYMVI